MKKVVEDVRSFMEVAGQDIGDPADPAVPKPTGLLQGRLEDAGADCWRNANFLKEHFQFHEGDLEEDSPGNRLAALRARLVLEETSELLAALAKGDAVEVADAIVDLIYVATGASIAFGIDQEAVWEAVQDANLAKFPPCEPCGGEGFAENGDDPCEACRGHGRVAIRDAGGKVKKPAGWTPPDVAAILAAQRVRA